MFYPSQFLNFNLEDRKLQKSIAEILGIGCRPDANSRFIFANGAVVFEELSCCVGSVSCVRLTQSVPNVSDPKCIFLFGTVVGKRKIYRKIQKNVVLKNS